MSKASARKPGNLACGAVKFCRRNKCMQVIDAFTCMQYNKFIGRPGNGAEEVDEMSNAMQKMNDAWTENLKDWTDESLERQDAVGPAHNGRGLGPADIEAVRTEMRRRGLQPRGPGTRGPGRPRTVTKPGDPPGTGNPMFRIRRDLAERVRAMGPGYLDRLIEQDAIKSALLADAKRSEAEEARISDEGIPTRP